MLNIIVNKSLMIPIYEQIVESVKGMIKEGVLETNDALPSVRSLAKDLNISALTVKKAYDALEEDGYTKTIHGKGTFVTETNREIILEEQRKEVEEDLERVIKKAQNYNLEKKEIKDLFELLIDNYDVKD